MKASFRELDAWRLAMDLMEACYLLARELPREERFGIISQLQRASLSVPSNISEGHGRRTKGEYMNALSNAQGSLNETQTLLLATVRLGYLPEPRIAEPIALAVRVGQLIGGLRRALS